jgi:ubiquinone/menaquinone biosynthesis C-methylase UbiE
VFAAGYDTVMGVAERRGLRERRRRLLSNARGDVVEVGAGTGINVPLYPPAVGRLVLLEPAPSMRTRLSRAVARSRLPVRVGDAPAEHLPFADASVDTVVGTFVLCTVDDPAATLGEIARVLKPGGRFLFLEHVRSSRGTLSRWQRRLARLWRAFACGCRCDQDTLALLRSRFLVPAVGCARLRGAPPLVSPAIWGVARRSAAPASDPLVRDRVAHTRV